MIPPDPLLAYQNAPLGDLLSILLRQVRRPLKGHGVDLTDAEAESLAHDLTAHAPLSEKAQAIRAALVDLIAESETVLTRWNLTFQQSLDTEMKDISGWESTAEFLEIANEKANAELRISTGASLLAALGDLRYASDLLFLVERGEDDLDAVIARRVLLFASGIDPHETHWLDQLRAWIRK
ncbi:MAG: hypothetical protein ABI700_01835 [Chloroflexota bacterium]